MSTVKSANFQHPNATNPAIVLAADGSATANVSAINGGPLAGMRNAIINGNFDFWQRGTGPVGNGFIADRWNAYLTSGVSFLQERALLTDSQRDLIGYESRYAWSGGVFDTSSSINFQQAIEGVNTFAGQQVTVSFWAFVNSGTCTISGSFVQIFGTGGSPSSNVTTNFTLSTTTVTTTPTKITGTVTLPSISGKVLGSDGNDRLVFIISRAAGVANTLRIAQVQIEAGPVATPFERRPIGTELSLCQRYYQLNHPVVGHTNTTVNLSGVAFFLTPSMRVAPSLSILNGTGAVVDPAVAFRDLVSITAFNSVNAQGGYLDCSISASTTSKLHTILPGRIAASAEL